MKVSRSNAESMCLNEMKSGVTVKIQEVEVLNVQKMRLDTQCQPNSKQYTRKVKKRVE